MLKSYFFIPADKKKFIDNMKNIEVDEFIFDFEDALAENLYDTAIENLKHIENISDHYVRPRLFGKVGELAAEVLSDLVRAGFNKFVLPKVSSVENLQKIEEWFNESEFDINGFKFILLIEDPRGLMFLKELLDSGHLNIVGLGLGSHDYARELGMKHVPENLKFPRSLVLNAAKAFKLEAIDIASMNISDTDEFDEEIRSGFDMGYDAKFIIHPFQLNRLKKYKYFSEEQIDEAITVFSEIAKYSDENFSLVKVNGKIFEKPHIERIQKIIKWAEENGAK